MTVNHKGHKATVEGGDIATVAVNGQEIGEFVFSDGHNGLRGFSNSFGVDCYQHTKVGDKNVWGGSILYSSKRSATKGLIDEAINAGLI